MKDQAAALGEREGTGASAARSAGDAVASPCIQVCRMDERSGLCEGCLRTLDEIAAWGALSDALRREVLTLVAARRAALDDTPEAR